MSADDDYTKKKASMESLPKFKKSMQERYDQAFLGILQNEERIEPFLDSVMSFLSRKTDFFRTLTEESQVGFPPGVAENMMRCYFIKYNMQVKEAEKKMADAPSISKAKEVTAPKEDKPKPKPKPAPLEKKSVEKLTQEQWQLEPESHNGAKRENYSWNQSYDDVDVTIPTSVANTRFIKVDIKRKHLQVIIENKTIIDGELEHEIKTDEATWSLEKGKSLCISLTKATEHWWKKLTEDEEEIDMQKIQPVRSMGDMDEGEAAVINQLQFDEMQKRMGKPTSKEMKVHEMLKQGWDAEGSPFKGQPFDMSQFKIDPDAIQM